MLTDLQRIEHMIETADLLLRFSSNLTEAEYAVSLEKQYAMKVAFVMLGEDAEYAAFLMQFKAHFTFPRNRFASFSSTSRSIASAWSASF